MSLSERANGDRNTEHCMVCGATLEYLAQAQELTCAFWGTIEHGHILCPRGHYTCDACHNRDSLEAIEKLARTTSWRDPLAIADAMMSHRGCRCWGASTPSSRAARSWPP